MGIYIHVVELENVYFNQMHNVRIFHYIIIYFLQNCKSWKNIHVVVRNKRAMSPTRGWFNRSEKKTSSLLYLSRAEHMDVWHYRLSFVCIEHHTSWFNSASLSTENDLEKFSNIIYKKLYL